MSRENYPIELNQCHCFCDAYNRHNFQITVYQYLKEHAPGADHAMTLAEIQDLLGNDISRQMIRIKVTSPLKKAGLIGSDSKGFFHIASPNDLKRCYATHLQKLRGLQGILRIYEKQARAWGIENLGEGLY